MTDDRITAIVDSLIAGGVGEQHRMALEAALRQVRYATRRATVEECAKVAIDHIREPGTCRVKGDCPIYVARSIRALATDGEGGGE